MIRAFCFLLLLSLSFVSRAEDGYRLWLRFNKVDNVKLLQEYKSSIRSLYFSASSATERIAKTELQNGLQSLLGQKIVETKTISNNSLVICSKSSSCRIIGDSIKSLGNE